MSVNISGQVAAGFEAVRTAFERNFTEHGDVGAGVAVYVDGECVVDLRGGVADQATGRAYDDRTLQLVFSTTKGAAAICGHLLAQRGLLDFDEKVSTYWPEFAANGKADVPVRWLFSHRVGLPTIDAELSLEDALEVTPIVEALAAQAPYWEPGTTHGYHALTYGWLVGELVRRVSGRTLGRFFADEIASKLGLEFWIGLPADRQDRVAPLIAPAPPSGPPDLSKVDPELVPLLGQMAQAFMDPKSLTNRALSLNGTFGATAGRMTWNLPEVRASEIPAANGVTNARSLAKLYASCVSDVDGFRLLDDDTVAQATIEQSSGPDTCLMVPTRFGLGFFLDSGFSPLLGATSFGHAGAGGSLGFADVERRVGFGYVMNAMNTGLAGDPRTLGLIGALRSCL